MEYIKHLSDEFLIWFLKFTSGFARELTGAGRHEQTLWREQRLRDLKGLSIMSIQRYSKKADPI
ncbi:MAG TPA: hypothetical protein VGB27_15940 [Candidatus Binatia bacterium]